MESREVDLLGESGAESVERSPLLEQRLQGLPDSPGVYLHKDSSGRVLYVGKASSLKSRVRSYFQSGAAHSARISWMVSRVHDLEYFLVGSPLEALILECNLIKKYRPYFNVKYRDDKRYPMLEITVSEAFPKARVVRQARNKKNRYFGPYPDAGALRRTLKLIQKVFQIRTCKIPMGKVADRPCLDYHIELCTAPCTRYVDEEGYREQVDAALDFLDGRSERLIQGLKQDMQDYAQALDFERCARLRDTLRDVERIVEKQRVVSRNSQDDEDYIGLASRRDTVSVHVLLVRGGKLIEQRSFLLDSHGGADHGEQMSAFIKEYYDHMASLPRRVLVTHAPPDLDELSEWLTSKTEHKVELRQPQRGAKRDLLAMSLKNAEHALKSEAATPSRYETRRLGLLELSQAIGLEEPPWRIECVDISNTQGKQAVGSLVVFQQGLPQKSQYRKFRIKSGDTPDDFRMMHEVLTRRFRNRGDGSQYEGLPDLLVVDGGKGQLSSACRALEEMGMSDRISIVGLAKKHEWIYRPEESEPIILDPGSKALSLITHLRDEAHRFAITFHRNLRKKASKSSILDSAPGIGAEKKKRLLRKFSSVKSLMKATPEEIAEVDGFGEKLARALHRHLHSS